MVQFITGSSSNRDNRQLARNGKGLAGVLARREGMWLTTPADEEKPQSCSRNARAVSIGCLWSGANPFVQPRGLPMTPIYAGPHRAAVSGRTGWKFMLEFHRAKPMSTELSGSLQFYRFLQATRGRLKVCALNNANSDKHRTRAYATNFRRLLAVLRGRNPSTATAACSQR